tara:strand:- start:8260 stop:8835 length:576 start_codon:yes stop_codon:yes gene_type:complete
VSDRASWPATAPDVRAVAELVPYARNARTHSDEQVARIARSITEFGWTNPVLVDDSGGIIAGHGRILAAKELGIVEVPVIIARGWTDEQRRAYVLADNKIALDAGWDRELLAFELDALDDLNFDLDLTGFDEAPEKTRGGVAAVDVPKGVNFVWCLVGVPIENMGRLQAMIDSLDDIGNTVIEVSDDFVEQ